jgi:maltose O-acetyltransferase
VNYGAKLEAYRSITVGARCLIASSVRILDRDGDRTAPVVLEDDVWVAHGATVCPGVRIGAGSAISAGAVVTRDIPPRSLAAGRPARAVPLDLIEAMASAHSPRDSHALAPTGN